MNTAASCERNHSKPKVGNKVAYGCLHVPNLPRINSFAQRVRVAVAALSPRLLCLGVVGRGSCQRAMAGGRELLNREVEIFGLTQTPCYNGRRGLAYAFDEDAGRGLRRERATTLKRRPGVSCACALQVAMAF